jgi:MFS family permease
MVDRSARLSQLFAWLGHGYMHLLAALFLTVVLALESEWALPYGDLIGLWTLGAFLVGFGAPFAGLLGDRWSAPGMMVVFFIGTGGAAIACGLSRSPTELTMALAALGLFASIYHPVGMAWLIKTAVNRGMALGIFGVFGSLGVALAGTTAGGLIDLIDWRAAFWIPGVVSVVTGLALWAAMLAGQIVDRHDDRVPQKEASRGDVLRAFFVLSLTVFLGGLVYQATQVAMPKALAERLPEWTGEGALGAGLLFTVIYLTAGALQIPAGWLADRYPLRLVYMSSYLLQVPVLAAAAALTGVPFFAAALLMVLTNVSSLPAENVLMARYTPARWRGSAFGAKFVLSLGVGPVAVQLVSWLHESTGSFAWLYTVLAIAAGIVVLAALLLPGEAPKQPVAAPLAAAE